MGFSLEMVQGTAEGAATFYLVLAPAPSLTNRGLSEAFVFAYQDGAFVHGQYDLRYTMPGMQHATDDETVELEHTHFEDSYGSLGMEVSTNHAPLSFPMAGNWTLAVALTHEGETQQASFDVMVLEE